MELRGTHWSALGALRSHLDSYRDFILLSVESQGECFQQSRCAGSHTAVPAVRVEDGVSQTQRRLVGFCCIEIVKS